MTEGVNSCLDINPALMGAKSPILLGGSYAPLGLGFIRLIFSGSVKLPLNKSHFTDFSQYIYVGSFSLYNKNKEKH